MQWSWKVLVHKPIFLLFSFPFKTGHSMGPGFCVRLLFNFFRFRSFFALLPTVTYQKGDLLTVWSPDLLSALEDSSEQNVQNGADYTLV